jgi:hypothetical protein
MAREKKAKRAARKPMDLGQRFRLHLQTTRKLMEPIQRCNKLRDASKVAEARKVFRQAERLNQKLLELEEIVPRLH